MILDGKKAAKELKMEIAKEVAGMIDKNLSTPHLAAVIVGEDPASQTYVRSKEKAAKSVGITSTIYQLPEQTSEKELLEIINFLNNDDDISGYIVQLPLPQHIDEQKILLSIDPRKDVDGFHPANIGRMVLGLPSYIPATPLGILELLRRNNIQMEGKNVAVIGRSHIVGLPMSILLGQKAAYGNATVTLCHSRTKNLTSIVKEADVVVAAIGVPRYIKAEMIKPGAVVIDVGIHRLPASNEKGYILTGDVDFEEVEKVAKAITPVPGGVGPMTIAALLLNTLKAHKGEIYS